MKGYHILLDYCEAHLKSRNPATKQIQELQFHSGSRTDCFSWKEVVVHSGIFFPQFGTVCGKIFRQHGTRS